MAALQERPKPDAADGPGLSVPGNYEVGKCGAGGGVKHLTLGDVAEHIGCRQDWHRVPLLDTPSGTKQALNPDLFENR